MMIYWSALVKSQLGLTMMYLSPQDTAAQTTVAVIKPVRAFTHLSTSAMLKCSSRYVSVVSQETFLLITQVDLLDVIIGVQRWTISIMTSHSRTAVQAIL